MGQVIALIPARSGSKGIPGKNFRDFGGKSLVSWAASCAWDAGIEDVYISTDHTKHGCQFLGIITPKRSTHLIARPADLAQDDSPMIAVVQHALGQIPGSDDDVIVLLQPTAVFRTPAHVQAAITRLRETGADSVVSVVELPRTHSAHWQAWIAPDGRLIHEWTAGGAVQRRQDLPLAYIRDGTVYAFWRRTVSQHGTIYGRDVRPLIIPADESCELDTIEDWAAVEARWKART